MNLEEKDEKIMSEIRKRTNDIPVPDSLSPENMMKKIKESGVKQDKKVKQRNKGVKWNFIFAFAGVAVAFCIVMSVLLINSNILFNKNKTSDKYEENNSSGAENFVISNNNVEGIDSISRKEAIDIFKSQLLDKYAHYNWVKDKNEYISYDESGYGSIEGNIYDDPSSDMLTEESKSDIQENGKDITSASSDEYYENNDQVKGVIEGDIVITDGKYIYSMNEETGIINIVRVNSGKMEKVSDIECYETVDGDFDDNYGIDSAKMYINDNKIVVVLCISVYEYDGGITNVTKGITNDIDIVEDYYYRPYNTNNTIYVLEYDVTNAQSPEQAGKETIEGSELSSRMVGNYLYIMSEKSSIVNAKGGNIWKEFSDIEENAIPKINGKEVTEDRMYICGESEDIEAIQLICAMDISDSLKVTDTCATLVGGSEVYVSNNNIYVMSPEYGDEGTKTIISKYNYGDGKVTVYAQGTVSGEILNQFSLDENEGYLRVVTTIRSSSNSVYILDDKLNITGEINGIAEGEHIKSVRFIDNRAYFVTFRQTDPLFVADLSDHTNPVILDELKVTGFSSYLHIWSEDLLLGIGSEATDEGIITGAKISMFSRTDDKLSEISRFTIDEGYLFDMDMSYKNILADAGKNLIGLGVYEDRIVTDDYNNTDIEIAYYYGVYNYEDGEIKNILKYENEDVDYDDYYYSITYRGLYVGDYLYIVTLDKGIQSINLKDMSYVQYLSFE